MNNAYREGCQWITVPADWLKASTIGVLFESGILQPAPTKQAQLTFPNENYGYCLEGFTIKLDYILGFFSRQNKTEFDANNTTGVIRHPMDFDQSTDVFQIRTLNPEHTSIIFESTEEDKNERTQFIWKDEQAIKKFCAYLNELAETAIRGMARKTSAQSYVSGQALAPGETPYT